MKNLIVCFLLSTLQFARGYSTLVAKTSTAYCIGNLTIDLISASCDGDCTFGSAVFLTGQVNATNDFPSETEIRVSPSVPLLPFTGLVSVYDEINDNMCNSNTSVLTAPAGDDAGYTCPSAGLYNFHTYFTLWGSPEAWYGSYYGYSMGVSVKVLDSSTDDEYASCYVTVMVTKGPDDPYYTYTGFIGGALAGLTGLTAGFMYRKRRVVAIELDAEESTATHFELISDPTSRV